MQIQGDTIRLKLHEKKSIALTGDMRMQLRGAILGPIAGTLVDRWDRRKAMLYSDLGAGISTIAIIVLLLADRLELWHIYSAMFVSGMCAALRWPALTAATTQLVPDQLPDVSSFCL
jgi:MFS family permease